MEWAKGAEGNRRPQLAQCMDTKATEAEVDKVLLEGRELSVDRTPTLFVNGRRLASSHRLAELSNPSSISSWNIRKPPRMPAKTAVAIPV